MSIPPAKPLLERDLRTIPVLNPALPKPSSAFVLAAWAALLTGIVAYLVGLWNAGMSLSEKGFYFTILLYGLFSAVSLQKSVRDQLEGIPVTPIYFGLSWASVSLALSLLAVGLWNASMLLSEKGFYAMAFLLALFAAVTVQKNTRDLTLSGDATHEPSLRLRWPTTNSSTVIE